MTVKDFLEELKEATEDHLTRSIDIVPAKVFPDPGALPLSASRVRLVSNHRVQARLFKGA